MSTILQPFFDVAVEVKKSKTHTIFVLEFASPLTRMLRDSAKSEEQAAAPVGASVVLKIPHGIYQQMAEGLGVKQEVDGSKKTAKT